MFKQVFNYFQVDSVTYWVPSVRHHARYGSLATGRYTDWKLGIQKPVTQLATSLVGDTTVLEVSFRMLRILMDAQDSEIFWWFS